MKRETLIVFLQYQNTRAFVVVRVIFYDYGTQNTCYHFSYRYTIFG